MTKFTKRSLAFAIALVMCLSLFSVFAINIGAASTSGTVNYKYDGKYIYNWGKREEVATFLSPNAISFYSKYNLTYELMASYDGGTNKSNVPSSELYKKLTSIMATAQTHTTSYEETKSLYKYTDCENNGSVISSFYSGISIGPAWDGGSTWNREHTWPNSKGNGSSENDIMMLRPTSMRENSGRGNKAYGESSSFYNPNKESNGEHDLRGDVARIFLYVYVRWGDDNRNNAWGSSGVMESPEIMLKWMEEDPVDTWELGRNDAVQAITGTRNVFVDYPELAFILFGEEVPSDMQTPSGNAKNGTAVPPVVECTHAYTNNCDDSCNLCGEIRVIVHVYSNNCDTTCNSCGAARTVGAHIYSYVCDGDCNECGATRVANHLYGSWQVIVEATETQTGLKSGKCIYCQDPVEREIPKLNAPTEDPSQPNEPNEPNEPTDEIDCQNGKHAYSDWEINSNGKEERYCNECGLVEVKSDEKPKCEHVFSEWEETENGKKERYCNECGTVEVEGATDSAAATDNGFFAKIADFIRNIFASIFSIFNK